MQGRHCAVFYVSLKARSHDELVALPELFKKRRNFTEIVGQVGIAKKDVFSSDERNSVDVSAAEPALGCFQNPRSPGDGFLRS